MLKNEQYDLFLSQIFRISDNALRAANNAFAGRMWPTGFEFETPDLDSSRVICLC